MNWLAFDAIRIAKYLKDKGAYYPGQGVGLGKISRDLGISPNKAIRGLRYLRSLGLVSRNIDFRRSRYSTWSISRRAMNMNNILDIVNFMYGGCVESGDLAFFEWIDYFLDRYYLSGTTALLLDGFSWSNVLPSGILLVLDRDVYRRYKKFYSFYRNTSLSKKYKIDAIFVSSIEKCDYRIVGMDNCAIPLASLEQSLVDSIMNYESWGVDILETLSILIGVILPQIFEQREQRKIRHMIYLAERIYNREKFQFFVATLRNILMRYYMYFEEVEALKIYDGLPEIPENYMLPEKFSRKIYEAFRATILGDRIAIYLGLEPDFTKIVSEKIPSDILSVSEA